MSNKQKITHESAKAHVSGTAEYIDDRALMHGEVFVDVYFSPHAHAKIKNIDLSEALKDRGVLGIYSHKDIHQNIWGNIFHDQPFLASEIVQYAGEAVLVIAVTLPD